MNYLEPFTGSAAVFLHLFGASPLTGFAGNKRRAAPALCRLLWRYSSPPDRVVLADVGPWRDVWEVYASGRGCEIIATLRSWPAYPDRELWDWLLAWQPGCQAELAAQYLYLQARQVHHAPIWRAIAWLRSGGSGGISVATQRPDERWRVGSGINGGPADPGQSHANTWQAGSGSGAIHTPGQRDGSLWTRDTGQDPTHQDGRTWVRANSPAGTETKASHKTGEPIAKGWRSGNPLSRATLIRRCESLLSLPWERVTVLGDYRSAIELAGPGDVAYCDPPYKFAKVRYAAGYPESLEEDALSAARRGALVAVSEGRILPQLLEARWWTGDITPLFGAGRKPGSEQLTISAAPAWTIPALAGGIQEALF